MSNKPFGKDLIKYNKFDGYKILVPSIFPLITNIQKVVCVSFPKPLKIRPNYMQTYRDIGLLRSH